MTKLEGGLKETNIIDAGVAYGKIVMRINIVIFTLLGTFFLILSFVMMLKKNKNENERTGRIVSVDTSDVCKSNNKLNEYSLTVKLDNEYGGIVLDNVKSRCRNRPRIDSKIRICGNDECNYLSKWVIVSILVFFTLIFYGIAFFYYKMKDNRYVAGYTALDSIFNRKSSMKRDGNSAMKEIINQSFGY